VLTGIGVEAAPGNVFVLLLAETVALPLVVETFEALVEREVFVPPPFNVVPSPLSLRNNHAPRPPRPSRRIVATTVITTTDEVLRGAGAGWFWNSLTVGRASCLMVAAGLRAVSASSNERMVGATPKSSISVGGGSLFAAAEFINKVSSVLTGASLVSTVPSSRQNLSVLSAYVRLHVGQRFILLPLFSADVWNPE
jgi:hypothetical protein